MNIEEKIKENISLAKMSSYKIGGNAKFFIEADNEQELVDSISWARSRNERFYIIGAASNILFSDQGYNGVIIKMNLNSHIFRDNMLDAESGASLNALSAESAERGLGGLENFRGIPGTLGGAVRGNAGCYGRNMNEVVKKVRALDVGTLEKKEFSSQECLFAYRSSLFKNSPQFAITSVEIELVPEDKKKLIQISESCLAKRKEKGDYLFPSAGCVFVNPQTEDEKLLARLRESIDLRGNRVPAGWIIDQLELKGKQIGGAKIYEKNANFIINAGKAKASDIITLISLVKQKARSRFGIQLNEEIVYLDSGY